jgi:hypothetical protein
MKKLFIVELTGLPYGYKGTKKNPDVGEWQGAFDEYWNLISYWDRNDASLRKEYFQELFNKLGFELVDSYSIEAETTLQTILYKRVRKDQYGK